MKKLKQEHRRKKREKNAREVRKEQIARTENKGDSDGGGASKQKQITKTKQIEKSLHTGTGDSDGGGAGADVFGGGVDVHHAGGSLEASDSDGRGEALVRGDGSGRGGGCHALRGFHARRHATGQRAQRRARALAGLKRGGVGEGDRETNEGRKVCQLRATKTVGR